MSKKNRKSSIVNSQSKKVWRIFHFKGRYELPEDIKICRKSGLQYTKRFVGIAGGDEAVGYHSQFALLENGDGLEACLLEGIYGRLVNLAAQHSFAKRGYLIDADDQPLTDAQIGRLLNINFRTMGKYLRLFESVKLLEKVELPVFDMSLNERPANKSKDKNEGRQGRGKCSGRRTPENSGKFRAPLKKRQTAKPPNGGKRVNEQKTTNGLMAVDKDKNKNDKAHKHTADGKRTSSTKGHNKAEPPSAPTTTPPLPSEPQESDDGGSKVIPFTAGPPDSAKPASGQQRAALAAVTVGYDRYDEQFGKSVYIALDLRWDLGSPQAQREICSFASKFAQARSKLSGLPPPVIDELGRRAVAEARKIARRGLRNKKPGAVLNTVIDKLVEARLREAM